MTRTPKVTRRAALTTGTAAGAALIAPLSIRYTKEFPMPSHAKAHAARPDAPHWLTLLGVSEKGGRDYVPEIEGTLPAGLDGVLYRNGPGLFERGGARKQHLLDGDGLIQRLELRNGKAHYRNAFVQTPKFQEEEAAGEMLHAGWTTRRPGGVFRNVMGGDMKSQAGVTVYPVHGKIVARDEIGANFLLDPETLETTGKVNEGVSKGTYKAHGKLDPANGDWIVIGQEFGPSMKLHVTVYRPTLEVATQFSFDAPRQVYIHDFFATEKHVVFVLHPCNFSPWGFLAGFNSFTDALTFKPEDGTVLAVVPRGGGKPSYYDVPASFMWHALNAYERNGEIVADFVGYDVPDHFIGDDPYLEAIMDGKIGKAEYPGTIRRYVIGLDSGTAREETLDGGNHEFPMTDPRVQVGTHNVGYFSTGGVGGLNSGIKRMDMETGATQVFDFGADNAQIGEPVFAPRGGIDDGWIIAQGLDAKSERSFFAVFDAQAVDAGPVAKVWLNHHVPISFHGAWNA